ncbi:hypothetical protein [Corynebacterium cystitidis]|uniref:hypothetical protein n=1 Tax=Corynebacterium cystitidis TaxID=35757 RepID=UPI00211ED7A6|nr:hypothetical protein [Corynebacterium cystitidis]
MAETSYLEVIGAELLLGAVARAEATSALTNQQESDDFKSGVFHPGDIVGKVIGESFFSTLKLHLLFDRKQFPSKFDAEFEVGHWIEAYYNRSRIHSTTGMI